VWRERGGRREEAGRVKVEGGRDGESTHASKHARSRRMLKKSADQDPEFQLSIHNSGKRKQ